MSVNDHKTKIGIKNGCNCYSMSIMGYFSSPFGCLHVAARVPSPSHPYQK